MTSTVVGKLDYEGDTARIEGDSIPTRKMLAKVAAFLKARPMKGKNVVAQIIEEGDKAGWIERVEELPLEDKMKKAGFGKPTPGPTSTPPQKEAPPERAPDELFTDAEVAAMKAKAAEAQAKKAPAELTGIEKICADTRARNAAATEATAPLCVPADVPAVVVSQSPTHIAKKYSEDEMLLLRNVIAKGCSEPEFKLLMYMASTYGLDPLLKQIWAVKRNDNSPALIFAGRDGMLAIAHRSGQFDGMNSGVVYEKKTTDAGKLTEKTINVPVSAWCEVWRKDMHHSFKTEVPFSEYNTGYSVWKSNPSAMILKVAESVCLRKAFSVSGLYCPEEINTEKER
jgi:phage recombination protein Bet